MHSLSHNKVLYRLSLSAMLIAAMSFVSPYILPSTTSALTYSSDTDVSFTFNPTLSISLSDTNINIDNLLPGLSSESSPITVHVNSNTPYGYSLFASVGNSTDYNTTSLVHSSNDNSNNNSSNDNNNSNNNNSIPSTFTSIATNASLPQLDTDNTWGYSFSNDNGTTWSNYNGLPLYSAVDNNTSTNNPALLIDTKSPADSTESIDFKIAAKASSTQTSGTYNNVINFYAVGKPQIFYMQEPESIQARLININDELIAMDQRDGKKYTIAKLADGKIWMTQNLNLSSGTALYSDTSDVPEGYSMLEDTPYYTLPKASLSVESFTSEVKPYVLNIDRTYENCSSPGCYSYYSWIAATAGSGLEISSSNTDAEYSICPKGWKLPTSRTFTSSESDFYRLATAYGLSPRYTWQRTTSFYYSAGPGTIANFVLSGYYYSGHFYGPGGNYSTTPHGHYWSSTSYNSSTSRYSAQSLLFDSDVIYSSSVPAGNVSNRGYGYSVRCLMRQDNL